jgi:hypothetical protein
MLTFQIFAQEFKKLVFKALLFTKFTVLITRIEQVTKVIWKELNLNVDAVIPNCSWVLSYD